MNDIIDRYLVKFNTAICTQLPTGNSVKFDIRSKPEQIVMTWGGGGGGLYKPRPAVTRYSDGPG